jgi:hypothetical protein
MPFLYIPRCKVTHIILTGNLSQTVASAIACLVHHINRDLIPAIITFAYIPLVNLVNLNCLCLYIIPIPWVNHSRLVCRSRRMVTHKLVLSVITNSFIFSFILCKSQLCIRGVVLMPPYILSSAKRLLRLSSLQNMRSCRMLLVSLIIPNALFIYIVISLLSIHLHGLG